MSIGVSKEERASRLKAYSKCFDIVHMVWTVSANEEAKKTLRYVGHEIGKLMSEEIRPDA